MQIELPHIFLVRASLVKGRKIDWRKVEARSIADFPERDDATAPMAFVFHRQREQTPLSIRYDHAKKGLFARKFKIKLMKEYLSSSKNDALSLLIPTIEINRDTNRRVHDMVSEGGMHWESPWYSLSELDDINQKDLRIAQAEFTNSMSNFIAADGWLWERIAEPMFRVYRSNEGWRTELSTQPEPRSGSDRRHFHFGLHQYQEMLDWKARMGEATNRPVSRDEFTSMGVYEPTADGYDLDLDFALLDMVSRFSPTSRAVPPDAYELLSLPNMPLPVLNAFSKARHILSVPIDERGSRMNADIVELLESIPEILEAHPEYRAVFAKPAENAFHIEKWNERPISLGPSFNAPSP